MLDARRREDWLVRSLERRLRATSAPALPGVRDGTAVA
jgi:hypothetical protein